MITQTDFAILDFIQSHIANPAADIAMTLITHLGDYGILWIAICLGLLCHPKTRKTGIALAVAMIAGLVICNLIIKNIVARPRPFVEAGVPILINPPIGYSFPSGHTVNSFVAATVIAMKYKKYALPAYAAAALIGFSRIYLYVHYPSDVIAGAVLGAVIGYATVKQLNAKFKMQSAKQT